MAMAARVGRVKRLFSTFPFPSSAPAKPPPPPAEPSTNLFVSVPIWTHGRGTTEEFLLARKGLSKRTTSEGLREAFTKFGQVVSARVVTDLNSGYSKGFGFVRYDTLEEAAEGIKGMDGKFLDGWVIFAEYARPRPPPPPKTSQPQSFN